MSCLSHDEIINNGGLINENNDGSVSVFINNSNILVPYFLNKICCETLNSGYTFNANTQTCKWETGTTNTCSIEGFKITLNPNNDDGSVFLITDKDKDKQFGLNINFDYLFNLKCETLYDKVIDIKNNIINPFQIGCARPVEVFEGLDISISLDYVISGNTVESAFIGDFFPPIGKGNLYNYISGITNTGFYVCGGAAVNEIVQSACTPLVLSNSYNNVFYCESIISNLVEDLFIESGLSGQTNGNNIFIASLPPNSFNSKWLNFDLNITDPNIIAKITNKKIKFSLNVNNSCSNFNILLDNIKLNQVYTAITRTDFLISKSPGFKLERLRDNKKSWVDTTKIRQFNIPTQDSRNNIRQTNYNVTDERLVINSKEIDLNLDIASAIEYDVWRYIIDNPCILTGISNCNDCTTNCCGDNRIQFDKLLNEPLANLITLEDFQYFITSELIDAKSRQTLSGYPTLRALYDRYLNSELYCTNISSKFNYLTIDQFSNLIGTYWIDIVEQVVPATTIWGSIKIYSNTIFDEQKFKYKSYSAQLGINPFFGKKVPSPIFGTSGLCTNVDVNVVQLTNNSGTTIFNKLINTNYNYLCIAQMNSGSEFIGGVIARDADDYSGGILIVENTLVVILNNTCDLLSGSTTANVSGGQAPYSYLWSNGETTKTAVALPSGSAWVIVTDANHYTKTIYFNNIINPCAEKLFQDGFGFEFMDGNVYGFEDQ